MRFPKITPWRLAVVASVVFITSTVSFSLFMYVLPIPEWIAKLGVPIWFLRAWPLGLIPSFLVITHAALRWGWAQWESMPKYPPIPQMKFDFHRKRGAQ